MLQVEILLPAFWDPASGAVFSGKACSWSCLVCVRQQQKDGLTARPWPAEEGDQQRFWKLTRRFIEDLAQAYPGDAPRVKAVS